MTFLRALPRALVRRLDDRPPDGLARHDVPVGEAFLCENRTSGPAGPKIREEVR